MTPHRNNPYGAFNFLVSLGNGSESSVIAGFSDVSGLGTEINYAEYRNDNGKVNMAHKIAATVKQRDVTFKRGLISSTGLLKWAKEVREGTTGRCIVTVTVFDEKHKPVMSFTLKNAKPGKWVGPTLAAKGGGDVAMEELLITHEGVVTK
ncbi:MAG: phage tail protein [Georgfuchsia sp.]